MSPAVCLICMPYMYALYVKADGISQWIVLKALRQQKVMQVTRTSRIIAAGTRIKALKKQKITEKKQMART